MVYLKIYESFFANSFNKLDPIDVENEMIDYIDDRSINIIFSEKK